MLVLHKGEVIARQTGAVPAHALRSWVEQSTAGRQAAAEG
jgi:thioredoxin 2